MPQGVTVWAADGTTVIVDTSTRIGKVYGTLQISEYLVSGSNTTGSVTVGSGIAGTVFFYFIGAAYWIAPVFSVSGDTLSWHPPTGYNSSGTVTIEGTLIYGKH